jgi:hypothetical protein
MKVYLNTKSSKELILWDRRGFELPMDSSLYNTISMNTGLRFSSFPFLKKDNRSTRSLRFVCVCVCVCVCVYECMYLCMYV